MAVFRNVFIPAAAMIALMVSFRGVQALDHELSSYMARAASSSVELTLYEKEDLITRIEEVLLRARAVHDRLMQAIQGGTLEIRYHEGRFWMSKLEQDRISIENAMKELKMIRNRGNLLLPAIALYKWLKDLGINFNTYNTIPVFSSVIGDLAPEISLWADPVFYRLYLVPLASQKDRDAETGFRQNEKKPKPEEKAPARTNKKPGRRANP